MGIYFYLFCVNLLKMTTRESFSAQLKHNSIVRGPLFPEPVRVILTQSVGNVKGPILVPLESGKIMAVLGQIDRAVDCPKIHAVGLHCILLTNLL